MYPDDDQTEVVFVHKLSSGEPNARAKALKLLHQFIKERSQQKTLTKETFNRLSKGIHYAMWMQDKPLLQEELADNMAGILDDFETHEEGSLFVEVFLNALSKEWHLVDRWRLDKFLMFMRRIIKKVFGIMARHDFDPKIVDIFMKPLNNDVISANGNIVDSLKSHFASFYWTELNKFEPNKTISHRFLDYYLDTLRENRAKDFYFKSICTEIFETLINEAVYRIRGEEEEPDTVIGEAIKSNALVPLDFDAVAESLFEIGAQPTINRKRRKILYDLSKQFKAISQGKDPKPRPEDMEDSC
ncbi:hypothetical protein FO519_010179 [Halicephalobus sp. NKZ332]|nr:hypothetical protein FO519_010179 [Halicephalobus sp. NKZ332]